MERILLCLYFPQFSHPNCSRFESFFVSILKKESFSNKNINKSKIICPERIIRSEDKRTSLIIRGIPLDMPKKEVRNFIEKYGNLNYLYIIKDPANSEQNSSIAYINVINYKSIVPLFMNLRKFKFIRDEQIFDIKINYANAQGKKQLKQFIKQKYFSKHSD
jgi:hypothetical protein